jgi:transcriptional regulator with XRE-family HTH domain
MNENDPSKIDIRVGARVRALRIVNNLSAAEVADWLSISEQDLLLIEAGRSRLRSGHLILLAEKFGVPFDVFFQ